MNKNTIVQFVCFVTDLELDGFTTVWEPYAKQLVNNSSNYILHEAVTLKGKNKFKYVSQHDCSSGGFSFAFMKGRNKTNLPEHKARVVQVGGYAPVQLQRKYNETKDDVKVIAFLDHNERDLDFYHGQTYRHLNVYEAYFESCAYSHVMEFFISEQDAPELVAQLKTRTGIEVALYKECSVVHS